MIEKTIIITGASDGIGKATALGLARKGARLVLVGRNGKKTAAAVEEIKKLTGNDKIEYSVCDLSSRQSIRTFADAFLKTHDHLDVLVNNAGAMFAKRTTTVDGLEATFALDHLGYFLLTMLLLALLKKSAPSRIVNVSSGMHLSSRLDFDDLMGEKKYGAMDAYGKAKLANVMFTVELASRLEGAGVTVNCLHPGFVRSNFMKAGGGLFGFVSGAAGLIGAISPKEGAKTPIWLATSPEVENVSGKYFYKCAMQRHNPEADDPEKRKKLWEASERLVGLA